MECHFYSGITIPPSAGGWELLFVVMSSFSANINFPSSSADIYIFCQALQFPLLTPIELIVRIVRTVTYVDFCQRSPVSFTVCRQVRKIIVCLSIIV